MEFTLKLIKGDDIRRLRVNVSNVTYSSLRVAIRTFYGEVPESEPILYLDDEEELCKIACDEELAEAIRIAQSLSRPSLRLFVGSVSRFGDNGSEISSVRTFTLADAGALAAAMDRDEKPVFKEEYEDDEEREGEATSVLTGSDGSYCLVEREGEEEEEEESEVEATVTPAPVVEALVLPPTVPQPAESEGVKELAPVVENLVHNEPLAVDVSESVATIVVKDETTAEALGVDSDDAPVAVVETSVEENLVNEEPQVADVENNDQQDDEQIELTEVEIAPEVTEIVAESTPQIVVEVVSEVETLQVEVQTAAVQAEALPSPPTSTQRGASPNFEETVRSFKQLLENDNVFGAFALIPQLLQVPEVMALISEWTQSLVNGVDSVIAFYENAIHSGELKRALEAAAAAVPDFSKFKSVLVAFFESRSFQSLPPSSKIHERVTCDNCQVKPIEGTRFKCYICLDYDLCEACYSVYNGLNHHPLHPFVAILNNDQSLVVRGSIPHGGDSTYFPPRVNAPAPWDHHRHGRHHHHHHWGHSHHRHSREDRSRSRSPKHNKDEKKEVSKREKWTKKAEKVSEKILESVFPPRTLAPQSEVKFPVKETVETVVKAQVSVAAPNVSRPVEFSGNVLGISVGPSTHQPSATFVKDVNIPDGSSIVAGTPFLKSWRLKNNGKSAWNNVRLISVGGNDMSGPSSTTVPSAAPGESVDVSVQLSAPKVPGRHVGYWRLATTDGNRFGDRVWVDIVVVAADPKEIPVAVPVYPMALPTASSHSAGSEEEYKWSSQLIQLMDLELDHNVDMWKELLEVYDGDMARVVEYYLNK